MIFFLDTLEETRPLLNPEVNLRHIIKVQLATLLHYRKEYWRKRYTVNRIRFGDECTKFFHAMATVSYRRNCIPQLLNDQEAGVQDHEGKAGIIWNTFKARMGVTTQPIMLFNLESMIDPSEGLESLTELFTQLEIDAVIRHMPRDKAPGPDGFNGHFLKTC